MKLSHLSGRKTCDYVLRKGRVWKGKMFTAYWLPGAPRKPDIDPSQRALYVGTFASGKLHKSAVARNRMRRRVREELRKQVKEIRELRTAQLLLSPRSASLKAPSADIAHDVRAFLQLLA